MIEVTRKAGMRLIIFLITITLGVFALAQADAQSDSSASLHRSTTVLVSPATASAGAYFDHVVIILMENQGVFDICRTSPPPCSTSGPAPYMASLANNYTVASQYLSLIGTSQPNYVALISGSLQGCTSSGCPVIKAPNLVDRFESAGISWRGYFENQTPTTGCDTGDHEPYTNIHNPFIAFQDITNNTARCNKLYLANPSSCGTVTDCILVNDLNNVTTPAPNFMWLTPNDCNNMRGASGICSSSISLGNTYLSKLVPLIINSRTFTTTRSALFITFDEGNGFCPLNGSSEDCVYASWSGPVTKTRFGTTNLYKHYSFTKTVEVNWNLASFTTNDANANPMAEFFKPQAADFTISANPAVMTFPTGATSNSTITLTSINNFTGTITLTRSSSPTGPTLTLNPTSITLSKGGTGTSTFTIISTTAGSYTVTVTGSSGSLAHNTTIAATVTPPPDFTVTSPSSLTLGQGAALGSPVVVNSTDDRSFFASSYLADSFNSKGRTWLFYLDTRSTCEHQTGCLMYTSSTNGSRWAPATMIPVHVTDYDFSVYTDGSNVYYVRYNETSFETTCGRNLQFRVGALSTIGAITWQPEQTVATGASNRSYPDDEIVVDSNGQVWIGYMIANKTECGGTGTDRPQVIHSTGTNYASWTGNTTLCVSVCHSDVWHIALTSLGNGQVYASYWLPNRDLHGRLYNNGWQAEEQISTTTTTSDTNAWLFSSGTNIYAIYYDNSTESLNFSSRTSTGTWTINRIGTGESHTGTLAFTPSYFSLPDTASFDSTNNRFYVFWMNATNHAIDQWAGSGSNWTRTTGVVSTGTVTYPDSITSFIQATPTVLGSIFYTSSGSSPFTINSVSLTFTSTGSTGMFTATVTGQNGFTGTVSLSTTTSPSTGLTVNCTPTSLPGGSGTSNCALNSSTPGNYTVTVTGTSGPLNHQTNTLVSVQQPQSPPDFTVSASSPVPISAGQSAPSTITVTALNGFSGTVSLTDTIPSGLTCGSISPGSITGSGTASVSCNASTAANYTLIITGTSGSLVHTTNVLFQFRDFTITATTVTVNVNSSGTSIITIAAVNKFGGVVTLADSIPAGLVCGSITPGAVTGSGTATVSCAASVSGNYTLTITGTSGSLVHTATPIFQVQDFGIVASSPAPVNAGSSTGSTITISAINHFAGIVNLTDTVPSGLTCGAITPTSLTGSGIATVSCAATVAGNYTLTLSGGSGSLVHTASALFQYRDFSIAASSPGPIDAGSSAVTTVTVTSLDNFGGTVSLTDTVPSGLACGSITPSSVTGSGTASVSCNASIAGNYTLTITGSSGSLSHSATVILRIQDFTMTATSPTAVNAGQSTTSTVTVAPVNGFAGAVTFSITPPPGLTCGSFSPTSITASGSTTVSCSATVAGNYTATITGTSTPLIHNATATFQFRDFTIAATAPAPVNAGNSATSTITVVALNHFAGSVSLTDTVQSGLTCGTITPNSVTGSGTATVSCNATVAGNYTLTITGSSGSLVHIAIVTLRFQDFTLSASAPAPANASSSATSTITVAAMNGFAGGVSFSDSVPSGLTCGAITPASITGSGTATVSCSATVAGNYTLTLTGTSGVLVHSATALFQFRDFTITTTSLVTANVGTSSISTLTVSALNHFSGSVLLSDTVPAGLACGVISPVSVTGSGSATVSCSASLAGNYTLTLTGTSGQLVHSATTLFQFQDFTSTASSPVPLNAGSSATSTITITSANHFSGIVSLTETAPSGLVCGAINPTSVTGAGTATVSCNASVAGNYTLIITATSSSLVHSATGLFQFQDFGMTATTPFAANADVSATSTISATALNHFSGVVALTDTADSGLTCGGITPSSLAGSGTATVSCSAILAGNYTLTITGSSSQLVHTATVTFVFQDFAIGATSPPEVNAGSSAASTIAVSALNGFAGTVSLSDTIPSGLTCGAISPTSVTGSGIAIVSCSATVAGNYTLTITGTSAPLVHTATVVFAFGDFTVSISSPVSIEVGVSVISTVSVTSLNHFAGTVSLTGSFPAGLACGALTPSSLTGSGTATMSCTATAAGTYTIVIRGTAGSLSHTTSSTIQAVDFSITGPVGSQVSPIGTNASSSITLVSLNGYSGNVSLTATVQSPSASFGGAGGGRPPLAMAAPLGQPDPSFNPVSIFLSSGGTGQSNLTIVLSLSVPAGNYLITVTASDGTIVRYIQFTLMATDFSLSSPTTSLTMNAGSNSTQTLSLQSLNGFQGSLTLSSSFSPTGPLANLSPSIVYLTSSGNSSLLTILVPSSTAPGTYTLTVEAASGTLSHTIYITVTVQSGLTAILSRMLDSNSSASIAGSAILALVSLFSIRSAQTIAKTKRRAPHSTMKWRRYSEKPRHSTARPYSTTLGPFWTTARDFD